MYVKIHARLACSVRAKPKHSVYHTRIYFDVAFEHVAGRASEDTEDKLGAQCQTIGHYSDGAVSWTDIHNPCVCFQGNICGRTEK